MTNSNFVLNTAQGWVSVELERSTWSKTLNCHVPETKGYHLKMVTLWDRPFRTFETVGYFKRGEVPTRGVLEEMAINHLLKMRENYGEIAVRHYGASPEIMAALNA